MIISTFATSKPVMFFRVLAPARHHHRLELQMQLLLAEAAVPLAVEDAEAAGDHSVEEVGAGEAVAADTATGYMREEEGNTVDSILAEAHTPAEEHIQGTVRMRTEVEAAGHRVDSHTGADTQAAEAEEAVVAALSASRTAEEVATAEGAWHPNGSSLEVWQLGQQVLPSAWQSLAGFS
jgi:hypothetical protein